MIKKHFILLLMLSYYLCSARPMIFEWNGGHIGDHLTSLYNAYVFAKKYNLELVLLPFPHCELFECSSRLKTVPGIPSGVIQIRNEGDVRANLGRNVNFYINVLSDRPAHDAITAQEAKQLCMINKNINLDYLPVHEKNALTLAVHVRKGNDNSVDGFVGQLSSPAIFDFDRSQVKYIHDANMDPFIYFRKKGPKTKTPADRLYGWTLKFPPEQYYIDQIKQITNRKRTNPIVIKIFTDDNNPQALIERFRQQLGNMIKIEFYNNRSKDGTTRIMEDLYLMSQCDILIRGKSGFSVVAELIGNFKTIIFPIEYRWDSNKLIMTKIVIRGEAI